MIKTFFFYDFIFIIITVFSTYMDLFLLYLVIRFTKASLQTTGKDLVLQRDVPSILFIQNQQLIREMYRSKLALESEELEKIREIAEVNEFLYYKLREEGLTQQIDEDIGIEFLNLDRILQRTQTIDSHDKNSTPTQHMSRNTSHTHSIVQQQETEYDDNATSESEDRVL